jgi:hypothetical protein
VNAADEMLLFSKKKQQHNAACFSVMLRCEFSFYSNQFVSN